MTANDVYEAACALMDEMETAGTANADTGYDGKAPSLINTLQKELAFYERTVLPQGSNITTLDDVLTISDDSAERIMPYGLAAMFALGDRNGDAYNDFTVKYRSLINTIQHDEENIHDAYDVLGGMT